MLDSLSGELDLLNEIIVVDNASSKPQVELLETYLKENQSFSEIVKLDKQTVNRGYFPGLNAGLALLQKNADQFVIVGNNDLLFENKFFSKLGQMAFGSDVMAVSPSVVTVDGVRQNPSMSNKPSRFRRSFYKLYYSNYYVGRLLLRLWRMMGLGAPSRKQADNVPRPIFIGIGAIYILTPTFFERHRNLEYPLFLYGEEAFLSKQIYGSGGVIWFEPALQVVHMESVSTSKLPSKEKYRLTQKSYALYRGYYE